MLVRADEVARERFEAAFETLVSTARERERLEDEARDAEALRRSDLIKTALLQAISHDFRTPLATMAAAVGGLESADLQLSDEDRAGLLETIRLELARITRLVTNLLDFSRLQAGAARPHPELWSVDDLVGQALEEVGEPERVTVTVPADLPAVRVDAIQLQRVLVNLLENALKFSGAGSVELRAARPRGRSCCWRCSTAAAASATSIPPRCSSRSRAGTRREHQRRRPGSRDRRGFAEVNGVQLELEARDGRRRLRAVDAPVARAGRP